MVHPGAMFSNPPIESSDFWDPQRNYPIRHPTLGVLKRWRITMAFFVRSLKRIPGILPDSLMYHAGVVGSGGHVSCSTAIQPES